MNCRVPAEKQFFPKEEMSANMCCASVIGNGIVDEWKRLLGEHRKVICNPYGEKPPVMSVAKFCTCVLFPDVISCAIFYLYRSDIFIWGGADHENWLFPLT